MARLWLFNPGHEEALARLTSRGGYTPTALVRRMMQDLAPLMRWMAEQGDYILRPHASLQTAELLDHNAQYVARVDYPTDVLELALWADEPHAQRLALRLCQQLGLKLLTPKPISDAYLHLSHRSSAAQFLSEYYRTLSFPPALIPRWIYPQPSQEQTLQTIAQVVAELPASVVLKRPYTSSGRGVELYTRPLDEDRMVHALRHCYASGGISLEPMLQRREDWAVEYYVDAQTATVHYVGLSHFVTSADGAYLGNQLVADSELYTRLAEEVGEAVLEGTIQAHRDYLLVVLAPTYSGYVGVDMMTYVGEDGQVYLHPCVEINVRATMGLLACRLTQRLALRGSDIYFRVSSYLRTKTYEIYTQHLAQPERYMPLVLPSQEAQFYAWVECGE